MIKLVYTKRRNRLNKHDKYVIHYNLKSIIDLIDNGKIMLLNFVGNPTNKITNCGRLILPEYYPAYINEKEVCLYYIYDVERNTIAIENKQWSLLLNYIDKVWIIG